jgi:histidine ammonia-lyase
MHQTNMETENSITSVSLDGHSLNLAQVEAVARHDATVEFAQHAREQVQSSAITIRCLAESDTPVYGVNTGFGIFAYKRIDPTQSSKLSRNLILSHAVGLGDPYSADVVRAAMLIRANSLAHGHSGVRAEVIDTLIDMLNHGVCPSIPSQGSLGSSGDLAPLAHLGLVLSTSPEESEAEPSGHAWFKGQLMSGTAAMQAAGLSRLVLGPKEGLAITNGATFSAALLSLACLDAERLLLTAEIAASLALEALLGASAAFDQRLHAVRPHPGQVDVAKRLRMLLSGSTLLDVAGQVQDAYSLRCTPQIIGPAWDILAFAKKVASYELNSATDNPLLFGEEILTGGNFHGAVIGQAADYLKIALANVGSLSERRTFRLSAEHTSAGLPPMLALWTDDVAIFRGFAGT